MRPNLYKNGIKHVTNGKTCVLRLENALETDFTEAVEYLLDRKFKMAEKRLFGPNLFASFSKESGEKRPVAQGAFLLFNPKTGVLSLSLEKGCRNFSFSDRFTVEGKMPVLKAGVRFKKGKCCKAVLSQMKLEDYGMCYVLRLPDGRFILIDGGRHLREDADRLFRYLSEESPFERPVIAAWFLTHPHSDHVNGFLTFMKAYGRRVSVERIFRNFPSFDNYAEYPKLARCLTPDGSESLVTACERQFRRMKTPVYEPHTGEIYRIGESVTEILCTMEDTVGYSDNVNAASLMFRIEVAGQRIFIAGDGSMKKGHMPERYGRFLRSDILQVPHHGFGSIGPEAEIRSYKYMKPRTALLSGFYEDIYRDYCPYRPSTRYLIENSSLKNLYTGNETLRLELPFRPKESNMDEVRENLREGEAQSGQRTWFFTGLHADNKEDFRFRVLNCTMKTAAHLRADLFFEQTSSVVKNIAAEALPASVMLLDLLDPESADPAAMAYNPDSLMEKGIPAHGEFAVRFVSDIPVVITR